MDTAANLDLVGILVPIVALLSIATIGIKMPIGSKFAAVSIA